MPKTKNTFTSSRTISQYTKVGSKNFKMGFGSLLGVIVLFLVLSKIPLTSNWPVVGFVKTFFSSAETSDKNRVDQAVRPTSDNINPTPPTGLRGTAVTSTTVGLAWSAGSDNAGIEAYDIFLNGNFSASVGGASTSVTVRGLTPNTTYKVMVLSRDSAGNRSVPTAHENKGRVFEITVKTSL